VIVVTVPRTTTIARRRTALLLLCLGVGGSEVAINIEGADIERLTGRAARAYQVKARPLAVLITVRPSRM